MTKPFLSILLIVFLSSCSTLEEKFIGRLSIYDSCKSIYSDSQRSKNLYSKEYYDSLGNLREKISFGGDDYTTIYTYDSNQKLVEEYRTIPYRKYGEWTIMKYDNFGRLIGKCSYWALQRALVIDTWEVEQVYFYNNKNQLVKEQIRNGNEYKEWKLYEYENDKRIREIDIKNNDTIWIGKYTYNSNGKLLSINKQNGLKFKNELFEYDSLGRMVVTKIESDEKPTGRKTYYTNNIKTIYHYNQHGQLIKVTTYSWNEDSHMNTYYRYEKNTKAHK